MFGLTNADIQHLQPSMRVRIENVIATPVSIHSTIPRLKALQSEIIGNCHAKTDVTTDDLECLILIDNYIRQADEIIGRNI